MRYNKFDPAIVEAILAGMGAISGTKHIATNTGHPDGRVRMFFTGRYTPDFRNAVKQPARENGVNVRISTPKPRGDGLWVECVFTLPEHKEESVAGDTDCGNSSTVKGKDGNKYDIGVDELNSAIGELHSCLKVCHKITISDGDVLREVLTRHFPHEFTPHHRLSMADIARIGRTIADNLHLYFTFKAKR